MAKYGKWLGAGLGWAFGGPIGAILGYMAGSYFDNAQVNVKGHTTAADINVSILILAAAVIKADGRISQSELEYVRRFFNSQFGQRYTEDRMRVLQEILKQNYSVRQICLQIKQNTDHATRLQLLHFLFGISAADGQVHPKEISIIEQMAGYLGINTTDFQSIRAMFSKDANAFYKILEIDESATDEEVKKAYRKMAVKHHPDKVNHLGKDFQKAAKEKFQKVNGAYEAIKKERGIS